MKEMDIGDVSVVVCTRNNVLNIERVVKSIQAENPGEFIVVDGNSSDGTKEILEACSVRVLNDPGKGLALARQIAVEEVQGKYIMFIGDDNVIEKGTISRLKNYIISHNWVGGGLTTRIKNPDNYWAKCSDLRWQARIYEGEREVIGTPYMFETEIIRKASYDAQMAFSDDSDIENRIRALTDKKYGYSNVCCEEIGKTSREETWKRFVMYGKSDAQYWNKYSAEWKLNRKIKSLWHPAKAELIDCIQGTKTLHKKVYALPYYLYATFARYRGWIIESRKIKKAKGVNQ